ncbi:MAG: hypothetical protein WCI11_01350 [Candidatus Methylumidiphilus sp.]
MTFFYRGAGVDTYWHEHDARKDGFSAIKPEALRTIDRLIDHISKGTVTSPYISLTRSYGVACHYAAFLGRARATEQTPGYVYRVEFEDTLPSGLELIDPVKRIAERVPGPLDDPSYQHDGSPDFLLGVVSPSKMKKYLDAPYLQPPPGGRVPRTPHLSAQLETLMLALRDAEILAYGTIPPKAISDRFRVFWDGSKIQGRIDNSNF